MLRIKDQNHWAKEARLDENDKPVKVVADAFKVIRVCYDDVPEPHIDVTCARVEPATMRQIGPITQFPPIKGGALAKCLSPTGNFLTDKIELELVAMGHIDVEVDQRLPRQFERLRATLVVQAQKAAPGARKKPKAGKGKI